MIQNIKGNKTTSKYYLIASTNFEKNNFKIAKSNLLKYLKKKYPKIKKQKLCQIKEKIRNMTSCEFTLFLITQHCMY